MKRIDLIRHMERHGAQLLREGGNHSVYVNRKAAKFLQFHVIAKSTNFLLRRFVEI
jgi:mRNA interferase HicA